MNSPPRKLEVDPQRELPRNSMRSLIEIVGPPCIKVALRGLRLHPPDLTEELPSGEKVKAAARPNKDRKRVRVVYLVDDFDPDVVWDGVKVHYTVVVWLLCVSE